MTSDSDPLERDLKAFRPRPPSAELSHRIAVDLSVRSRWPWRRVVVGGLVAAGLLAAVLLMRAPMSPPQPVPPRAVQLVTVSVPPPTVQAYRRAMAESPEAIDQLLARQADRFGSPATPLNVNRLLND
jgi:hypothetical protein